MSQAEKRARVDGATLVGHKQNSTEKLAEFRVYKVSMEYTISAVDKFIFSEI